MPTSRNMRLPTSHSGSVPMSRSTMSASARLDGWPTPTFIQHPVTIGNSNKRPRPRQLDTGFTASFTYGSTAQPPLGGTINHNSALYEQMYSPAAFIEMLNNDSEHQPQVTVNKRARVAGPSPSSLFPHPYHVSPSTSMSSNLSPTPLTLSSEAMSRQSSATSAMFADAFDMLRVDSTLSDPPFFPLDEAEEQAFCQSFLSDVASDVLGNSEAITDYCRDEYALTSSLGFGAVGSQQLFLGDVFPSVHDTEVMHHDHRQEAATTFTQQMRHSPSQQSNDSNVSGSSEDYQAATHLKRQVANGKRQIASKHTARGPTSATRTTAKSPLRPLQPLGTTTKPNNKQPISKQPYIRPQHPRLHCTLCTQHLGGFRGEHELRRHHDRAHTPTKKVWICVDPGVQQTSPPSKAEQGAGHPARPVRPLNICKQCKQGKQYNVYYNAAAHLRRAHFFPRKRGRKARGEERESRAGKAGGEVPSIAWLKSAGFLREIEVRADGVGSYVDDDEEEFDEAAVDASGDEPYLGDHGTSNGGSEEELAGHMMSWAMDDISTAYGADAALGILDDDCGIFGVLDDFGVLGGSGFC
ncbi:hypothetical protein BDY17DRAFT_301693 [Neohortaea acidophila]|uniref:DUF7896 domain-containing protein n=1 Tax=Neohortaea acidophila TaxID=245834 RepID=A0A6A6PKE7_9PEZI|nr:uncharacterized protein BDY17DRAFT_301693 [Neohortaea acidophila]KAF2480405.1 hypothetical protein BDY17DRAFT_301693 [Neohortaea acidophila]